MAASSAAIRAGVRQVPSTATALCGVRPLLGNRTVVPAGTRVTSRAKKLSYMGTLTVPRGASPPEHPASTAPASASTTTSGGHAERRAWRLLQDRAGRRYLAAALPDPASDHRRPGMLPA